MASTSVTLTGYFDLFVRNLLKGIAKCLRSDPKESNLSLLVRNVISRLSCVLLYLVPAQQPPPTHRGISPTTLELSWAPPDHPNGVITSYTIHRDGVEVAQLEAAGKLSWYCRTTYNRECEPLIWPLGYPYMLLYYYKESYKVALKMIPVILGK